MAAATVRIGSTWMALAHTSDEPAHIACGVEWLQKHTFKIEPQHPPLSRVAAAVGPYLDGARMAGIQAFFLEGAVQLYAGGRYWQRLAMARAGELPFFWLASLAVFLWARRGLGPFGAVLAILVFTTLPPVLAHAGLATTDMALVATFALTFYALLRFSESAAWRWAVALGLFAGLMTLSKFSGFLFAAVALVFLLIAWWRDARPCWRDATAHARRLAPGLALAGLIAFVLTWSGYFFSWGIPKGFAFATPFPELIDGMIEVRDHAIVGHDSYFLGEVGRRGWFLFFPVVLAIKTPLACLALSGIALWRRPSSRWAFLWPLCVALGILVLALWSSINIGVRHVLPIYVPLAILSAAGALALLESACSARLASWCAAGLLAWTALSGAFSHPDYISYFNALAGDTPEKIVTDSDLDWGQDTQRLADRLKELGATSVAFTSPYHFSLAMHGFPAVVPNDPLEPAPGWNAVSLTFLKRGRLGIPYDQKDLVPWPERYQPRERVGRSILLYYFIPAGSRERR